MVFPTADLHALPAAMFVLVRWLVEHEALAWCFDTGTRFCAAGQRLVVGLEVVSKKREAETALALERTVAGAAVAAQPAKQWHDMPPKVGNLLSIGACKALAGRCDGFGGIGRRGHAYKQRRQHG